MDSEQVEFPTSTPSKQKQNVLLLTLGIVALMIVASSFFAGDVLRSLPLRLWTLRFALLAVSCFCLGMFFRSAIAKSLLLSFVAIFAALGCGEAYWASQKSAEMARQAKAQVAQFGAADTIDEFADELGSDDDGSKKTAEAHMSRDLDQVVKFAQAKGIKNPNDLILYGDEFTTTKDPVLGYRPHQKEFRVGAVKLYSEDDVIYNVVYSFLPSGWRVTPQHPNASKAVVFFGCSFTFGEGLDDADSFPYKVGKKLGKDYQVYNFGFHGYGSHQMLAMLENGFLDEIASKHKTLYLFYTTIHSHELRSAGESFWDQDGPCYKLENGKLVHKGSFRDNNQDSDALALSFGKDQKMLDLHIAIMEEGNRFTLEKYHTPLTIITWPGIKYAKKLQEEGLMVLDLRDLLNTGPEYTIPDDGHPNQRATEIVADRIVTFIESGK